MKFHLPKLQSDKIALGSLFFAFLSHLPCCLIPLVVGLGLFSGITVFTKFQPYLPIVSLIVLAVAWVSFTKSKQAIHCCSKHKKSIFTQTNMLAFITLLSVTFNVWGFVNTKEIHNHLQNHAHADCKYNH